MVMPRIKNWIDSHIALKERVKRRDDVLASAIHIFGFTAALAATVLLLLQSRSSSRALTASVIYGLTMCGVFAFSSLYHMLKPSTAKRIFRLLDHSSSYLLIACTYTPYAAAMGEAGTAVLFFIWGLCLIGLVLNLVLWDRLAILHIAVYLLMGWLVVFFWDDLVATAPIEQIRWMFLGGGLYTVGVFFYMYRRMPGNHLIWHLFVIGGAAGLHMGIARYAIPAITG